MRVCLAETYGKLAPSATSAATDRQRAHGSSRPRTQGFAKSAYARLVNRSSAWARSGIGQRMRWRVCRATTACAPDPETLGESNPKSGP